MAVVPLITVVVPSYNQGCFLEKALSSIFEQNIPVEVFVMDGGSTDNSVEIIQKWSNQLAGWRSHRDAGQSAAINEGVAKGQAPFVCWLNSDDWFLAGGLATLLAAMEKQPDAPAVYGRSRNVVQSSGKQTTVWVEPFNVKRLALRCIISQPATLIRRTAWNLVGGLDTTLHMAMDYDLWWRLFHQVGSLTYVNKFVAVNREHALTKTSTQRRLHYREAMGLIRKHNGQVPLKWWLAQPYAVWFKTLRQWIGTRV